MTKDELEKRAREVLSELQSKVDIAFENKGQFNWLAKSIVEKFGQECFEAGRKQAEKLNAEKVQNLFKHL